MSDAKIKLQEQDLIKQGLMVGAALIADDEQTLIQVSPSIDIGIGGGIPPGSWVNLSGKPKCGKSTLALHIAAKSQLAEYGSRPTFIIDVEHRIKPMHLKGISGLKLAEKTGDYSGLQIIRSTQKNILGAEELLTAASNIIKTHPNATLIVDSTSALCSAVEQSADISGQTRNLGPKIIASFCRKMASVVPVQNTIVVMIQHLIANTSGYGSPFLEDGGSKMQYQSDVKLRCKGVKPWTVGNEQIGQDVTWEVLWSANGPPGAKCVSKLRYGIGIDEVAEMVDIGVDLGLVDKAGAWFTMPFLNNTDAEWTEEFKDKKLQGVEKINTFLRENDKAADELYTQISYML